MIAAAILTAALSAGTWTVDASQSTLRYQVTHKLHLVTADSHEVEGKALVKPDGSVLTEIRAPIASFKSSDGNRDEHMAEALDIGRFPLVVFKGLTHAGEGGLQVQGQVELHGVKKSYPVSMEVTPQPDGSLRVKGAFEVSLKAHQIELPSLLFIEIDDACHIEVDLLLKVAR
jgi:polyisoprenoid-binding protein YceI